MANYFCTHCIQIFIPLFNTCIRDTFSRLIQQSIYCIQKGKKLFYCYLVQFHIIGSCIFTFMTMYKIIQALCQFSFILRTVLFQIIRQQPYLDLVPYQLLHRITRNMKHDELP